MIPVLTILSLLGAPAQAGSFQIAMDQAETDGLLLPVQTGTLLSLGGEDACSASDDPQDCDASRAPAPPPGSLLHFSHLQGCLLPGLGVGASPSLLLPLFPFEGREPVYPALFPTERNTARLTQHLLLPLPDTAPLACGPLWVDLLAAPQEVWLPAVGEPVVLPLRVVALRLDHSDGHHSETVFSAEETGRVVHLLGPTMQPQGRARLDLATRACQREVNAGGHGRRRGARPGDGGAAQPSLVLDIGPDGRVKGGGSYDLPAWSPRLEQCLMANARHLALETQDCADGCLAVLPLPMD